MSSAKPGEALAAGYFYVQLGGLSSAPFREISGIGSESDVIVQAQVNKDGKATYVKVPDRDERTPDPGRVRRCWGHSWVRPRSGTRGVVLVGRWPGHRRALLCAHESTPARLGLRAPIGHLIRPTA